MKQYLGIVKHVLEHGVTTKNRTDVAARVVPGMMFEHDMAGGFPLLTTKKMPFKCIASELEFFIRGITDKQWLQERRNHIWDEWAHPKKAPYGHDQASRDAMVAERDLGPIYGFQWRHFGAEYTDHATDYTGSGVDQLKSLVHKLKKNPHDRRMLVSAWNPTFLEDMALPPCHYAFQVVVTGGKLNLLWNQRSVDVMLGLPFNIASYALLLHLLAKEAGLQEGRLVGFLGNVHVYENHVMGAYEQVQRDPGVHPLPVLQTGPFTSLFDWSYTDSRIVGYTSYPKISFQIAV